MNRNDFSLKIKDKKLGIFSSRDIQAIFGVSTQAATMILHRYTKKGVIIRIKRGMYSLPDTIPPELYIANKLYSPSYVSREFALSYHGIIPEMVYEITSVSTKPTRRFQTVGKIYSYRRIIKTAFTGYTLEKQRGFTFLIATPEKAFVDTLYYRVLFSKKPLSRFNKDKINKDKALKYGELFKNQKLISIIKTTLS